VNLDGSLGGPSGAVAGPDFQITESMGIRPGGGQNLFHSFGKFNIAASESAIFSGSADIANIIARVTGGVSSIDGLVRSTINGANLFLLNPAGVMFGPNARLDVKGSFHVSTADYLKFNNNEKFSSDPGSPSVLSVADPAAFGFLNSNPAALTGNGAYLEVPEGQTLSMIGGDITYKAYPVAPADLLFAPAVLTAPGGAVNLASVAASGELNLADMDTSDFARLGSISFTDGAKVSATSWYGYYAAGTVVIRGGNILLQDTGVDAYGNPGGRIDIRGRNLHLDNAYLVGANANFYDVDSPEDHPGTAVHIDLSEDLIMTHAAVIDTQVLGTGSGGSVEIAARNAFLGDASLDATSYNDINYYGYISTTAFGSGDTGNIALSAKEIVVRNGFYINTQTYDYGDAGDVSIQATERLSLTDQANIGTGAYGIGSGGIVTITAPDIFISAANREAVENISTVTGISAQAGYASNGGTVNVTADSLEFRDGGQISSVLYDIWGYALGRGADVNVSTGELIISGYIEDQRYAPIGYALSGIDSRVLGAGATGTGGDIIIDADSLFIDNGGVIRTGLYSDASGTAGNIDITAGQIEIGGRGQIYADSFRGTGDSGDISITADGLQITGAKGSPRPDPLDFDFTGVSTSTSAGQGGAIALYIAGDIALTKQGGIQADTRGTGTGGTIVVEAGDIQMSDEAFITAASTGTGDAGNIDLTSGYSFVMRDSSIATEASVEADGGNINIRVPYMIKMVGSTITSSVGGGPETTGGNIAIDPEYFIMKDSSIIANAFEGTGGNIRIVAGVFWPIPVAS